VRSASWSCRSEHGIVRALKACFSKGFPELDP
jgi:hypothetical protein